MFKYTYIYNIPAEEIQYDIFRRILRSQSINDEMRRTRITSKNTRNTERPIKRVSNETIPQRDTFHRSEVGRLEKKHIRNVSTRTGWYSRGR